MGYFFVYKTSDGTIQGFPYATSSETWTNIPKGCAVLGPIDDSDTTAQAAAQAPNEYTVQNGALVHSNPPTPAEQLASAQQAKLAELDVACQQTIYAGFDCDPDGSGTKYHFPYQALDQRRYDGYMVDVLSGDATDQAWKVQDSTGKWVALTITAANFKANVRTVATSFEKAQVNQFRSFESQVNAVTTSAANAVETVNAITWAPATSY